MINFFGSKPGYRVLAGLAAAIVLGLSLVNLTLFPRTWFDEGSHLHVPKTLVTYGVYADYSSEGFRYFGPSIGIGPTVMLPIAITFKLFGVGLLQARLIIVAYLLVAAAGFFALARAFGGNRMAWLATAILIGSQGLSLLELGRQVLGEVPGLAFLVLGWLAWVRAETSARPRELLLTGAGFGLASITKNQFALLIVPAIFVAGLANLIYFRRLPHRYFVIPLIVTLAFYGAWQMIVLAFLGPGSFSQNWELLKQFSAGAAFVFSTDLIQRAIGLLIGPDVFAGWIAPVLVYGVALAVRRTAEGQRWANVMILVLGGLAWYTFASISWLRYAFLPLVLATLVAAKLLDDLIGNADLHPRRAWSALRGGDVRTPLALSAVAAFALMSLLPLALTARNILRPPAPDVQNLAAYLNANIPKDVLIETWEPELGFLTDHNYHFPPHALLDTAVRNVWQGGPAPSTLYDPGSASAPYIIVGPFAKYTGLYNDYLSSGAEHTQSFGDYDIYRRVPATP